jgi:hypothetical protein
MDTGQRFQSMYQVVQLFFVVDIESDISMKYAILGFHGKGVDVDAQFSTDQVGDLMDDTDIVDTGDLEAGEEGNFLVFGPFGLYHAMTKISHESGRIRAIGAVDDKAFAGGHETKDIIARDGFAAIGQVVHYLVAAFAEDDQLCVLLWLGSRRFRIWPWDRFDLDWFGRFKSVAMQFEFLKIF